MKSHAIVPFFLAFLMGSSLLVAASSTPPTHKYVSGLPVLIACHGGAARTERNATTPISVPLNRGINIVLTNPPENSNSSLTWVVSGLVKKPVSLGSRSIMVPVTPDGFVGLALKQTINTTQRQFWFTPLVQGTTTLTFNLVRKSGKEKGSYASSMSLEVIQTLSISVTVGPAL